MNELHDSGHRRMALFARWVQNVQLPPWLEGVFALLDGGAEFIRGNTSATQCGWQVVSKTCQGSKKGGV